MQFLDVIKDPGVGDGRSGMLGKTAKDSQIIAGQYVTTEHGQNTEGLTLKNERLTHKGRSVFIFHPLRFTDLRPAVPYAVPVSIEAFIGEDAAPRASITGIWSIRLADPYRLTGPNGPPEDADTLIYHCHIILKPE